MENMKNKTEAKYETKRSLNNMNELKDERTTIPISKPVSRTATEARRFLDVMEEFGYKFMVDTDLSDEENTLYVSRDDSLLWEPMSELMFKRLFIDDTFNKKDILSYSNSELHDIYELVKVYVPEYNFYVTYEIGEDNDDMILINGVPFNIDKREFIIPEDVSVFKTAYPFIANFMYSKNNGAIEEWKKEVISLFEGYDISESDVVDMIDDMDIYGSVLEGTSLFDLEDFIEPILASYEFDEEMEYEEDEDE